MILIDKLRLEDKYFALYCEMAEKEGLVDPLLFLKHLGIDEEYFNSVTNFHKLESRYRLTSFPMKIYNLKTKEILDGEFTYDEARTQILSFRKDNIQTKMFPKAYSQSLVSEEQALSIVEPIYQERLRANPSNYGDLCCYMHDPMFFHFYCRDFEKEMQGFVPGHWAICIDKMTGEILSREKMNLYLWLNDSF